MAEIFESGSAFDALAARQRSEQAQTLRQSQDEDERNGRRTSRQSREGRSQDVRTGNAPDDAQSDQRVQRFNATEELQNANNDRTPGRVIDQNGNEVRPDDSGPVQSGQEGNQQPPVDLIQQRDERVAERQSQQQVSRTEQRLHEQVAQEQVEQASFDPSLPRGSIVDLFA